MGATVFLTTHYLEEAEAAEAVCVIAAGRVIEYGSPSEIKARYPRRSPPAARDERSLEDAYLALIAAAGGGAGERIPAGSPTTAGNSR